MVRVFFRSCFLRRKLIIAINEQEQQLIQTVGEVAQDQTADHFLALHLVQQLTDQIAEECCQRHGHSHRHQEAAQAGDAPLNDPQGSNLGCHSANGNSEVDAHAGHDGQDQSKDDEGITAQTAEQLIHDVRHGETGEIQAHDAQKNEHDGHGIVANHRADISFFTKINHGNHLRTWSEHTE